MSQHTIAGTVLTMPVRVRTANLHSAMFSVRSTAAQRLVDYTGLRVCEYLPGRALVNLMLMRYVDSDLGSYHEFGTAVMVHPPGSTARGPRALSNAAAFIHHLPVDQAFTLEAGRTIWGFPKVMADFTVRDGRRSREGGNIGHRFGFDVSIDGKLVAGIEFGRGLPMPAALTARSQVLTTYSHADGVTREIPWEMRITGMRARVGGARVRLGDHPYATELASLGLPKRALASQSAANVDMTFGDAHELA